MRGCRFRSPPGEVPRRARIANPRQSGRTFAGNGRLMGPVPDRHKLVASPGRQEARRLIARVTCEVFELGPRWAGKTVLRSILALGCGRVRLLGADPARRLL